MTLAWDRAASHTNLSAFILKWGVTSGSYTGQVSVATNLTTTTVNNLVPGVAYFFAVTARNVAGLESDPSNEISYTVPGGGANATPVATAGSTSTPEDQPKAITLSGTDADGDPLTYSIAGNPLNGTLSGTPPNVTYQPNANFNGSDSFTFRVNDGTTNSAAATVSITVTAVNDAPTLSALSPVTVAEDSGNRTVTLSGIGSGAANESQPLSVTASSGSTSLIPHPTVSYTSAATSGTITFRPATNASGTATITVTVSDGQSQNATISRSFVVTVSGSNDFPTISDITDKTVAEGSPTSAIPFTIGDQETAASGLTVTGTSSNTGIVPNTGLVFGGSGANRNVTITPAPFAFGTTVITLQVNDGSGGVSSDSFTLTVTPVNQAPTLNALANLTIAEDSGLRTVSLAGITTGASNETQTLTVTASSSNTGLIPNPTVTHTSPNSTGSISFTPVANAVGAATITVTVSDGQAQSGTLARTFTVTVTNVNDLPTISNIANQTVNEGNATATIPFTIGDLETSASGLTVSGTSSNPTLVPNASIVFSGSGANRNVRVTPAALQFGTATITVTVSDGTGGTASDTFVVTVNAVNQAPTLNTLANLTINEDAGQQTINLAGISTGAANEADTLTVTASSGNTGLIPNPAVNYTSPNTTGTLTFTPVANASGSAVITVMVNDGQGQSNTVTRTFNVTVNPVNDTPTLNALSAVTITEDTGVQTVSLSGISSGAGNESQPLAVTAISSTPSLIPHPTVSYTSPNTTGTLAFRPATNATGTTTITVTVNDGQSANNTVTRTFAVTVQGLNDPPAISSIADQNIDQNTATPVLPFTVSDVETPAASLAVVAASSNPTLVPTNNIVLAGTGNSRSVQVTPAANQSGSANITLFVSDGVGGIATETFTVYVDSVNQPPTLDPINGIVLNEDAPTQTISLAGISTGAFNELQTLTVTAISGNPGLIPNPVVLYTSPNFTGSLLITPAANASGSAIITVTVDDAQSENSTVTRQFTVVVEPVNDSPVISNIADQSVNQNTATDLLTFTIGDAESPAGTLTIAASSSNPTLVPNSNIVLGGSGSNRTVRVTPLGGQYGSAVITINVADGSGGVNSDSFILNVVAVNLPPTLDSLTDLIVVEDGGEQTVNLTGITSGSAQESQTLTVTAFSSDTNLFAHPTVTYTSPNSTGTLKFNPLTNASGAATITVTIGDGQSQNSTVTRAFTVTVNAVNDAPTLDPIENMTMAQNSPAQTVPLLGIFSGAENENQTLVVTATSSNPGLVPDPVVTYFSPNSSGTIAFLPAGNSVGSATITVIVDDSQDTDHVVVRSFTVTVTGENAAPTISDFIDRTIPMNGVVASVPFTIGDLETPVEYLRVGVHSSNPSLVHTNDIVISGTGSNRVTSVMTTRGQHGFTVITYTVYDTNGASSSDSFVLTVVPPNSQPTLNPIPSMFVAEDSGPHVIPLTGISGGGSNDLNQTLIVSAYSANPSVIPHPTIDYTSPNNFGTLTFSPARNVNGSATIVVTVNDGQSLDYLVTRTFGVIVEGTNDAPTISSIPKQEVEQSTPTVAIPFIVNDLETPADNLSLAATSSDQSLVPDANIVLGGGGANRTVTVTPASLKSGTAIITIFASDGALGSSTAFQIIVGSGNTPPVLAAPASLMSDSYAEAEVPVTVSDRESRPEDLILAAASMNSTVLPDANISFSGSGSNRVMKCRPVPGKSGNVMVNLTVNDGKAQTRRSVQLNVQVGTAPTSTLSVRRNGRGTIKPQLDGAALTIGKTYTIAAIPAADEVFVRWGRGATSSVPNITFVMTSNLVLEVTFTNNPFMQRKGLYNGLFYEAAEVRPHSSGSISITPTERGTYTGKLRLGVANFSISGSLDLAQKGTNTIVRKGTNSLTVELDFGSSSNQVVGRVTDGTWEAPLIADRNTYSKTNPCALAGTYTLVLPGQSDAADGPEGDSYGTIKVDAGGMASLVGTLADGTKFSCKSPLSALGQWPVYASVPGSAIISWMTFADRPTDDITGLLSWIKTAQPKSKFYRNGFTNETPAVGSSFVRPADPNETLLELTDTTVAFSGGNLTAPFSNDISWGPKNKITNLSDNKLTLTVNPSTGLFTGSVTAPDGGKPSKFSGALLQKANRGSGFLLGTDLSSLVVVGE